MNPLNPKKLLLTKWIAWRDLQDASVWRQGWVRFSDGQDVFIKQTQRFVPSQTGLSGP